MEEIADVLQEFGLLDDEPDVPENDDDVEEWEFELDDDEESDEEDAE